MNKSYYSEFTLSLIDEVKKREILYNTKFEKRPKSEIDSAWNDIAGQLETDAEKCKKHWKNVRDRFVKIMHLRDKHFFSGGSEIDAPAYVYYDKLLFMRDFSIKKYPNTASQLSARSSQSESSSQTNFSPDLLIYEQVKDSKGTTEVFDMTDEFLEAVKQFSCLYDDTAELRKFRSNTAWKAIENKFGGKFTVGKLRSYWIQLMKKYKYYMTNYNTYYGNVENEQIFEKLFFVSVKLYSKPESTDLDIIEEDENLVDETNPESVNETQVSFALDSEYLEDSQPEEIETPLKKQKLNHVKKIEIQPPVVTNPLQHETVTYSMQIPQLPPVPSQADDEYDLFGKKVALQLREIASKNRSVAKKGEIKVLQLLLDLEESIN